MKEKLLFEVTATVKDWRYILKCFSSICHESLFSFEKYKMQSTAVDPAHVALISMDIHLNFFSEYLIHKDVELSLDIDSLLDRLKYLKGNVKAKLSMTEDYTLWLHIYTQYGVLKKRFYSLDPVTFHSPKMPMLELKEFKVSPIALREMFKHMNMISDHSCFSADGKTLNISAEGNDYNNAYSPGDSKKSFQRSTSSPTSLKVDKCDKNEIELDIECLDGVKSNKPIKSLFSNDYMSSALKCTAGADQLLVGLGDDNPIILKFSRSKDKLRLFDGTIMLAPRIESE